MTKTLFALAALAALPLTACNNQPETVESTAPDPMASALANAGPIELPPAMKATVTFRCKDNSLVYVDFFEGDKLANLRTEKGGSPIQLKAETAGEPLTHDGYSLTGDPQKIELTTPEKGTLTCTA